jgi:hypothetical protein
MSFKSKHQLIERIRDTQSVLQKYPDRIPIICEKSSIASYDLPEIDKKKYLVPNDLTIGQFVYIIRKRLQLLPQKAIFIFINGFKSIEFKNDSTSGSCIAALWPNGKSRLSLVYAVM